MTRLKEKFLKAVLYALYVACEGSLSARVPEEAVTSRFPKHEKGDVKKALKILVRRGLAARVPKGRKLTYSLTREGLEEARRAK